MVDSQVGVVLVQVAVNVELLVGLDGPISELSVRSLHLEREIFLPGYFAVGVLVAEYGT